MKRDVINLVKSIAATVFIGMGCVVYLNYPNIVGAVFFAVGLLGVLMLELNLFTGRIGYVEATTESVREVAITFVGNILGALLFLPFVAEVHFELRMIEPWWVWIFKGFICGCLIYLSVDQYKASRPWVTLVAVPAFILIGAEHCIADMIYLVLDRCFTAKAIGFILLIAASNALGSISCSLVKKLGDRDKNE